jgi:hypothetical protein
MKFTIQDIADNVNYTDFDNLFPGYSPPGSYSSTSSTDNDNNDCMFSNKNKFIEYATDIIEMFDSFPPEFPIYRSISVKSEKDIIMDNLGESWSFDFESAKNFGGHNRCNIMLSAIVTRDNVDWYASMNRYVIFSGHYDGDDENEIVVIDTEKLKNLTVSNIKEAKEIGENPIFTRVEKKSESYVKNFESWLKKNIFEDALFEPTHIKRFSEISMSKAEIKNKFGDLIKQLQELILHLFDKNESPIITCKVVSVYDKENDDWVDGLELPDGEFSKMNLKDLGELLRQKKKLLPCTVKITDDKGKRTKEPIINGYIKFLHPKTDKQNDPSMPWENKNQ